MNTDNMNPVRADVVIEAAITSVVVTVIVEEGTIVVKTSRRHVQMSINNSSPNYVIQMMMFLTIRQNADHVRADVVIAAPTVISVIVTLTVEEGTNAVQISR